MLSSSLIFDRTLLHQRRNRAAQHFTRHDFLHRHMANMLQDRLQDIRRDFACALLLGAQKTIRSFFTLPSITGANLSLPMLEGISSMRCVCDEERLPFAPASFDLVLSIGGLHWVNDLPGALIQIRHMLKPDGLFLGIFPGGQTLWELREAITLASIAQEGGISPRVSPMIDVKDAGALLQRAGFALPVAESDRLGVSYANALNLMHELRGMGETNALMARPRTPLRRATLAAILNTYHEKFADAEGRIPATFELITLTGWSPHASQQQPSKRGSAKMDLKAALLPYTNLQSSYG